MSDDGSRLELYVVDDLYADPWRVRTEGLTARYHQPHPVLPWLVSAAGSAHRSVVDQRVQCLLGRPLHDGQGDVPGGTVGRFSCCLADAAPLISVHSDPYEWAAVVFLSPEPPPGSGTAFLRHRETGRSRRPPAADGSDLRSPVPHDTDYELSAYDVVASVPNRYNRLVVYDGRLLHAAESYYGNDLASGRLTQTFFWNTSGRYRAVAEAPVVGRPVGPR
ncbi:MAG: DUF6445 family protein [Acidimicrobiales bacterium]